MRQCGRFGWAGLVVLLAAGCAPAGPRMRQGMPADLMDAEHINAPSVQSLDGFSQAVRVGTSLYVSDQVALDSAGAVVGGDDLRLQLGQSLRNLSAVLTASRALPADYATVRDAITGFMPAGHPPALTLVGVSALPAPGLKVAIDAVAHVRGMFIDRERLPGGGGRPPHGKPAQHKAGGG